VSTCAWWQAAQHGVGLRLWVAAGGAIASYLSSLRQSYYSTETVLTYYVLAVLTRSGSWSTPIARCARAPLPGWGQGRGGGPYI